MKRDKDGMYLSLDANNLMNEKEVIEKSHLVMKKIDKIMRNEVFSYFQKKIDDAKLKNDEESCAKNYYSTISVLKMVLFELFNGICLKELTEFFQNGNATLEKVFMQNILMMKSHVIAQAKLEGIKNIGFKGNDDSKKH